MSVATNALMSALHANMNDIQLAKYGISLCAGAFMIAGGMLGIIIGWKKNFRIGVVLAILGEFMLALSSNVFMFIWGGRFLVGLGASFMIPSVLGLIPGIYEGNDRVFAFGAIGAATGIAACVGPIVAGVLLDKFGFRIAFGALAVYFILILAGSFYIPDVKKSEKKLKTGSYWYRRYCYWIVYLLNWYFQSICMGTYHTNSCTIYHLWYLTSNSMYHIRIGYSWHYGCDRKKSGGSQWLRIITTIIYQICTSTCRTCRKCYGVLISWRNSYAD